MIVCMYLFISGAKVLIYGKKKNTKAGKSVLTVGFYIYLD